LRLPILSISDTTQWRAPLTSELRHLRKTNSDLEACSDQESLRALLTHLRAVADDLELDFAIACLEAETRCGFGDPLPFEPVI
jgi:hypothetical protein